MPEAIPLQEVPEIIKGRPDEPLGSTKIQLTELAEVPGRFQDITAHLEVAGPIVPVLQRIDTAQELHLEPELLPQGHLPTVITVIVQEVEATVPVEAAVPEVVVTVLAEVVAQEVLEVTVAPAAAQEVLEVVLEVQAAVLGLAEDHPEAGVAGGDSDSITVFLKL